MNHLEALQNAANACGLTIHEKISQDKRKTIKRYFANKNSNTVSAVYDYEEMNAFLIGYIEALRTNGRD